ncbi:hypothetical protein [Pseudofulvimonas gallinarii]|jgi:hypothetical protein|uniref:DUF2029 domain-containing protein n=1 Tax=Pseudofulvimonas gallinarii TaxID=634155 RepID=A0A4S3KWY2_9GAMM|nr:hypothetical protein [Pseudofulvimonas gallinarii]TCS98172.1 hypothetical protein EDC25_10924 [Pseudofulvimonas gallinarii]THD13845.1 hypothetical protein B1808_06300 [Pseudofulvimonas gallinarii]
MTRRLLLTSALAALCLAATLALFLTRGWVHLGVPHFHPELRPFTDTKAHLETAAGCRIGLGEWQGSACFVPDAVTVPRAQTYQPWLFLHDLGLLPYQHYSVVAWVMIVLFWLAYARLAAPDGPRQALVALLVALTAGVQLGVERGNFDLFVFVLMAMAALALPRRRRAGFAVGTALLAFATALKLYTGAATLLSWLAARQWHWRAAAISALMLAAAIAIVGPAELLALGAEAPEGATRFSTGIPWLAQALGWPAALALASVAALSAGVLCWRRCVPLYAALSRLPPASRTALHLSAFSAVPLFALKASYDYRFVIWLPAVLCLLKLASLPGARGIGALSVVLFFLAAGMELPLSQIEHWSQTSLDFAASGTVQGLVLLKQLSALLLAALIGSLSLVDLYGTYRQRSTA